MRPLLATALAGALLAWGCAAPAPVTTTSPVVSPPRVRPAPPPRPELSPREREALLLLEMDRSRKRGKEDLERMAEQARRQGQGFLERQEQEARERSIGLYRTLLQRFPDNRSDFMAEATFRLAELLFERERDRIRRLLEREGEAADLVPDFGEALANYRLVIERFPEHPLAEDALYGLAYCHTEQGDVEEAAAGYERLIALFPKTRYAVEIRMRLGEHYFSAEDLPRAIPHYRAVVDSGDPDFVDKALYKLGWCYYNLDQYEAAIDTFFSLLDFDLARDQGSGSLADEAVQILARCFAESSGTPGLARQFARRGTTPHSPAILLELARLYKERSFYPEAIGTYRTFAETFPADDALDQALAELRECYFVRGDVTAGLQVVESLPRFLGPGSPWHDRATPQRRREALASLLDALESAAHRRRARAQAAGQEGELAQALQDIATYESLVQPAPCRILHLKGVLQSELGVFPDAVQTLAGIAGREECADLAPAAALEAVSFQLRWSQDRGILDLTLLESSVRLLEAKAPADPFTPKAVLALGETTLNSGDLALARSQLSRLIRSYPQSPEADLARMHVARTFFLGGDFTQAASWYKEGWKQSRNPETAQEAKKLHVFSLFKRAEGLSASDRRTQAAEAFEDIFRQYPDSEVAQISLYNAGKLYRSVGLEMRATSLFEELASAYRESDLATEALQMSVLILEALGDPARAAEDSLALSGRLQGEERGAAMARAADLFSSAGAPARAASVRRAFLSEHKAPDEERARQWYLLGRDLEAAGGWPPAAAAYSSAVAMAARGATAGGIAPYAARSQLRIAEEAFERFSQAPVAPPLDRTVAAKRDLLQETVGRFVAAGNYRVADVITASNFYIGRALELFKESILGSPRPEGLDAEELREYDTMLEEMAYPFEERALKAYRVNIQRAVELEILDPWIEKSYRRMAELAPWAYQREEVMSYPVTAFPPPPPVLSPGPTPSREELADLLSRRPSPPSGGTP